MQMDTQDVTLMADLQQLDRDITPTLLNGEKQCSKTKYTHDPWSRTLSLCGRTLTYQMARNRHFHWSLLWNLRGRSFK
jgi:hypothetical protein